jgi:Dolichyl-phosphate-mannose-protein mannosyltransferase
MKRCVLVAIVALILALQIFMRLPMLDDIFCDPDVAGVAYSAQELQRNGALYSGTVETKPPGAYILFAAIFEIFGRDMRFVHAASVMLHAAIVFCLFLLGRAMLGNIAGIFAAFFYAIYSVSDGVNGWCPNFESWPLLPIALGFFILWRHRENPRWFLPVLAGLCLGSAIIFKQTIAIFGPAALPLLWFNRPDARKVKALLTDAGLAAAGATIPIALASILMWSIGEFGAMIEALNPAVVAGYMSSEGIGHALRALSENGCFFIVANIFLFLVIAIWLVILGWENRRGRRDEAELRALVFCVFWFAGALAAFAAGTKFFRHYFILLMPPLALMAGFAARRFIIMMEKSRVRVAVLALVLVTASVGDMRMEVGIAAKYFKDRFVYGHSHWDEDLEFGYRVASFVRFADWSRIMKEVGECVARKTRGDDPIYVWDYEPGIYWYANRRAPTRHFMYFNVATQLPEGAGRWHADVTGQVQAHRLRLMRDLHANPPAWIITLSGREQQTWWDLDKNSAPMFPELANFTGAAYALDPDCSNYYINALMRK